MKLIQRIKLSRRFAKELNLFKRLGGVVTHVQPITEDYSEQAGSANGHYFHQDLLVASLIFNQSPTRHIDIGSRIDGFVAHVASFRKIEVMDVRDLKNVGHQNISFCKIDLTSDESLNTNMADSISCLHAIEHFGLGRYGDPIDPIGHIKGFNNLLKMLQNDGVLYISFPISNTSQVHFNAHRVFDPTEIFTWIKDEQEIELIRFDYVDDQGNLHQNANYKELPTLSYGCGIYTIKKIGATNSTRHT